MNINDVKTEELWPIANSLYETDNALAIIFARQRELMEKYLVLEAVLMDEPKIQVPVDIHGAKGQQVLKARAWWITEELVEALDALEGTNSTKFLEEISDALHFMTELWILTNIPPFILVNWDEPCCSEIYQKRAWEPARVKGSILNIIVCLGRAMWQLRNKPWKKTQVLTDIPQFTSHLKSAYDQLVRLLQYGYGLNLQEICLLYLRKSEVNKFRQRSNY